MCITCADPFFIYDTASKAGDDPGVYMLCLKECGSGIPAVIDESDIFFPKRCVRDPDADFRFIWNKFGMYGDPNIINEEKPELGVNLVGGADADPSVSDPVPA